MDIPKDIEENKKLRLQIISKCEKDLELREIIKVKCSRDFLFFIDIFGWSFNPRLPDPTIPFILYPFQEDYVKGIIECIDKGQDSFTEKSRDMGVSWLMVALSLWYFLFKKASILYGSYKEDYVDSMGNMDSFFERLRFMKRYIPKWFFPDDLVEKYMNVSSIKLGAETAGDSGQNFGRGGRRTFVILDEFSYWQYDQSAWRGTRDVTNARIFVGCVTKDTIIIGKHGLEDIGESPEGYIDTKKEVYGKDGFHKVEQRYGNGFSDTIKVKTTYGFRIEGTPNHRLLTKNGFKRLDSLKLGDKIFLQKGQNIFGNINSLDGFNNWFEKHNKHINYGRLQKERIKLDKNLAYLLGLIFAEGCWDSQRLTITNNDQEIKDFLLNNNFIQRDDFHFRLSNARMCALLDWIGMPHGAKNKVFSKWILQLRKPLLIEFLRGYFDGDGSSDSNRARVACISSSERLIRQLQVLLLNFGIVSSVYSRITPPTERVLVESLGHRLEMTGNNAWLFYKRIGFRLTRKQGNIKEVTEEMQHTNGLEEKMQEIEIKSLEKSQNYCYDFVIPDTHQYFTNGFISHNTPNGAWNLYGKVMTGNKDYAHLNIRKFRLHWSLHPLKTKEWYEKEKSRRTREDIARELDISYDDSVEGAVYKNFMQDAKFVKGLEYNRELGNIYTAWDFGRDTTAIIWFQKDLRNGNIYIFDTYQNQDQEIDFYMAFINGKPTQGYKYSVKDLEHIEHNFAYRNFYSRFYGDPYNGKSKSVVTENTIVDIFQKYGYYLDLKPGTSVEDRIDKTKLAMRRMIIREDLYEFIQAIVQSRYPSQKENSQNTRESTLPIHDSNSHIRTALEYLCDNEEDIVPIFYNGNSDYIDDGYEKDNFESNRLFDKI